MSNVDDTLAERESMYGEYTNVASTAQCLKDVMRVTKGWINLSPSQRESLDMVANKIARILNGDPNIADHWHDIAGYARLVEVELEKNNDT